MANCNSKLFQLLAPGHNHSWQTVMYFQSKRKSFQKRHDFSVLQLLDSLQIFCTPQLFAESVYISETLEGESSPQNSQILPKIRTKICYKAYLKYRILPSKFASSSVLFLRLNTESLLINMYVHILLPTYSNVHPEERLPDNMQHCEPCIKELNETEALNDIIN